MSVYGYTPPQWSKRQDTGFTNARGNAANRQFLGQPAVGPINQGGGAPNPGAAAQAGSVAGQQQRFMQTLSGGSAQGYGGGARQSQNRTIGLDASGNPAANFGGFAAISNYLQGLGQPGSQQYQQGAQYLRQNGMMGTYNGISQDQLYAASGSGMFDLSRGGSTPGGYDSMGNPTGNAIHSQGMMQSTLADQQRANNGGRLQSNVGYSTEWYDASGRPIAGVANVRRGAGANGGDQVYVGGRWQDAASNNMGGGQPQQQGGYGQQSGATAPGMGGGFGGANTSGAGPTGLPLEGQVSGAISGILAGGGSPYSQQQQQQLRNQSTQGIDQQYGADQEAMEADAVRRGLNPGEMGGSQRALAQGARNSRQQAITQFDLGQAQAAMGNKLSAVGAGTNLMGTQIGNEDSIRRYLAMLGAAQNGAPLFMGNMG